MKANAHSALSNREIGDIWDEEFEKLLKNDQTTNTVPVDLPPEAKAAGEALNQIFGGDHELNADLSFDQVYTLALPHFITIMKHIAQKQDRINEKDKY
ncbi:MAG: hypothetical protein WCR74_14865 [Betaproteobacteria bacterium]